MDRELLDKCKKSVEVSAIIQGQPIPEGFTITYDKFNGKTIFFLNEKVFLDEAGSEDKIVTQWCNGEWEDQ
jgi:hypothetical protein